MFVLLELGRRRILHCNVTDHPSAEWTLQQLREALPDVHPFGFLIHDRDSIFSLELDKAVAAMGVRVLRTHGSAWISSSPWASGISSTFSRWILHYNHGRVHMYELGPGYTGPA